MSSCRVISIKHYSEKFTLTSKIVAVGRKVTAKVQWLSKTAPKSRARWMHCTPLLGVNDAIGVWMVILVDDDDERDDDQEHDSAEKHSSSIKMGSDCTADALPWDAERQKSRSTGVSTTIWSDGDDSKNQGEDNARPKPRRPLFRQPSDVGEPMQQPFMVRPGPKIAGKAYSFSSINDGRMSADDGYSIRGDGSRPTSSSSTMTPIQSTMQPKVRIAGRPSMDGDSVRRPPVNMPYRPSVDEAGDEMLGRPPARRTYKSLSPYGILFED